jgi:hypothetical protein
MDIVGTIHKIQAHIPDILVILSALYGLLAAIVKACPTLATNHWLLPIIKFLAKLTNNQTNDEAVRTALEQSQNSTQATGVQK